MNNAIQVLLQCGYVVLFAFVLAEQVGLPIPAVPVLLAVGALAGTGRMSVALALGPGLSTVAPPLAGVVDIPRRQFLVLDSTAALVSSRPRSSATLPRRGNRAPRAAGQRLRGRLSSA